MERVGKFCVVAVASEIKSIFLFLIKTYTQIRMADEDISLTEDQLLDNLDDTNNGDSEFLIEVNNSIHFPQFQIIPDKLFHSHFRRSCQDFWHS